MTDASNKYEANPDVVDSAEDAAAEIPQNGIRLSPDARATGSAAKYFAQGR